MPVQGGYFYPWDNYDVAGFHFEGTFDCVVVCDCNPVQSTLFGKGNNLFEGYRRVTGIAGVNVKVNFQAQRLPFILPDLTLFCAPHLFQFGLKLFFGFLYFAEKRPRLVYLVTWRQLLFCFTPQLLMNRTLQIQ